MSGRAIEVKVVFFNIFTVIAFTVREPKQSLFEYWIGAVPKRYGEAEKLLVVGEARQPILAPPVGTRSGLVMGEVVPRVAVCAVVFAYRPPLSFAQIRSPLAPWNAAFVCFRKPLLLG